MQAACAGNGVQLRPQTRVLSRLKALLHQQGPIATNRLLSSQMTRPVSLICVQAVFSQRTVFCRARFARAWAARDFRGRRRQGRMSKSSQARRASALHQRQEAATPSSEAGRGRSAIGALPLLLPSAGVNHPSASARADAVGCWGSDGLSLCEIAQGFEERPQPACCDGGPW